MHRAALGLLVVLGFLLRVLPRWRETFPEGGLRLADPDGWHHLRQVEQWARHFPERMRFDPYGLHPGGMETPVAPLFDGIAAAVAHLFGGAAAAPYAVAILPAVCGALLCLPAFALGRRLAETAARALGPQSNRTFAPREGPHGEGGTKRSGTAGGLVAAVVVASLPGQTLLRSMLGFADHHALEALLAASAAALLAASLARPPEDARGGLRLAAFAGVVLGLHQLSWTGGALLVAAIGVGTVAVAVADGVRGRLLAPVVARTTTAFGAALVVFLPFARSTPTGTIHAAAIAGATIALAATAGVVALCRRGGWGTARTLAAVAAMHAGGVLVVALLLPAVGGAASAAVGWLTQTAERSTVSEARPLLLGEEGWTIAPLWWEFGVPGLLAFAGAAVLLRRIVLEARGDDVFLAAVFAGGAALAMAQVRFVPYAAVAAAALSGLTLGPWLGRAWRGEAKDTPIWLGRGVWPAVIAVGLVVPTWPFSWAFVRVPGTPREPWVEALRFLREKTPEPFGDAAVFERIAAPPGGRANPPQAAYGVLAWWDAGYWITQIAHRAPLANPTQAGAGDVARFLLEQDPAEAARRADDLGARYVVLDAEMLLLPRAGAIRGTLPSVANWAGLRAEDLVVSLRDRRPEARSPQVVLFLPAYFRSQFVRMFLYSGAAVAEDRVTGVAWSEAADGGREVAEVRTFRSYDDAERWRASVPGGRAAVGSTDPVVSCVPLEPATGFRLVGRSSTAAPILTFNPVWNVQVWERVPD